MFAGTYFAHSYFARTYFASIADSDVVDLGRFRLGDRVSISCQPEYPPDSVPSAVIAASGAVVSETRLASIGQDGSFSRHVLLGHPEFSVGIFQVVIIWTEQGQPRGSLCRFEVVPGGDGAGRIVSIFQTRSGHVVAQTESGELLQGSNPYL